MKLSVIYKRVCEKYPNNIHVEKVILTNDSGKKLLGQSKYNIVR